MEKFRDITKEMVALRDALAEIADSKSLTATPTQFYQHLQRIASNALSAHAARELQNYDQE
jgi:FKBP-type peptidyl-prolyl cis-trans isomerase (trigger factor)